jgi:Domain of unknown function (DUF1735)
MKKPIYKLIMFLLAFGLGACLDDSRYAMDPYRTENVIEFADTSIPSNPSGAVYPVYTTTTEIVPEFIFEQIVSYSGPKSNSRDITLTLAVDPTALDEYNQQMNDELHGATYTIMPSSYYEFGDLEVTIPKGETKATISIKAFPGQFDLTKNFALPIRIVSASYGVLSTHFSVGIFAVVVKNKYDGIYKITGGSITRNSASGPDLVLGGSYVSGLEVELATINGNTCGWAPLWKDGSGVGGIAGTRVVIDEVTNLATVSSTGNASMKNTPATINNYDPVTRTFTLSFDWGVAPNTRIISDLKLKWDRVRP